jgi:hypothetical protein
MIGYILTIEQKELIQGVEYAPYECFNCAQDINGVWFNFMTEAQKKEILNTEWSWILTLPEAEYIPPPPPPFPPSA